MAVGYCLSVPLFCGIIISLIAPTHQRGVKLGLCGKTSQPCQCGNPGYTFHVEVQECTFFYKWKRHCKPCDEISSENRCAPYQGCTECRDGHEGCTLCPLGRYGTRCQQSCSCLNGASCDINTGQCICPPGYNPPNCVRASCLPPQVSNSSRYFPVKHEYEVGETLTFSCDDTFALVGPSELECKNNQQWNSFPPRCELPCPLLSAPLHGAVQQPKTPVLDSEVAYSCNSGYRMLGGHVRKCQSGSKWSGVEPICEKIVLCNTPEPIAFGAITILRVGHANTIDPGSTINYACNQTYVIVGTDQRTCSSLGQWSSSKPACIHESLVCQHPGPLKDGEIKITGPGGNQAVAENSTLEFKCKPLHYMVGESKATCKVNGTWSAKKPFCFKLVVCPALDSVTNGRTEIFMPEVPINASSHISRFRVASSARGSMASRVGGGVRFRSSFHNETVEARVAKLQTALPHGYYHVGTRVDFSCESRYYDLVGSRVRTCTSAGEWSGRQPACIPVCGRSSAPRKSFVVGGEVSTRGQWPWQVGVARRVEDGNPRGPWFLLCGGALINENWVLTAAHCITYPGMTQAVPPDEFLLYFGKHYRNSTRDDDNVQRRIIADIYMHEHYEPTTFESDIALLKLKKPVMLTSRVQPICLPTSGNSRAKVGMNGTISGWGEDENKTPAEVLRHTEVQVVDSEKCEDDYRAVGNPLIVSNNMFCAGYEKGVHDTCSGDSGGPLVFPRSDRKDSWVLEGLVSWGSVDGCGIPKQYGGYVRVERFLDWIHQQI